MLPNDAVVFLSICRGTEELAVGTGFLYQRNGRFFIVTAWHNVTGRHSETLEPLSKKGAFPDHLVAHVACQMTHIDGRAAGTVRLPFNIPLEDDETTHYLVHPQGWPRVDVVAIPIEPEKPFETAFEMSAGGHARKDTPMVFAAVTEHGLNSAIRCIQDYASVSDALIASFKRYLTVSDDLFVVGYPRGIADYTLQPLWKRATVATIPHLGWNREKMFLVDCASRQGMSGAPAITFTKTGTLRIGATVHQFSHPVTMLHGIYVGRQAGASEFEAQIGTIWSTEVIDEIIDANQFAPPSHDVEAGVHDVRELIRAQWPESDGYDFARDLVRGHQRSEFFSHAVGKELNGRASFDLIDRLVMEEAVARFGADDREK